MDEQKNEIVRECVSMLNNAMREAKDAMERLEDCGIQLCSHQFWGSAFHGDEVQVFSGIRQIAEVFNMTAEHPKADYADVNSKIGVTINEVWYFQLGQEDGYTFL